MTPRTVIHGWCIAPDLTDHEQCKLECRFPDICSARHDPLLASISLTQQAIRNTNTMIVGSLPPLAERTPEMQALVEELESAMTKSEMAYLKIMWSGDVPQ